MKSPKFTFGALCALAITLIGVAPAANAQVTYKGKTKEQIKTLITNAERQSNVLRRILENRLNVGLLAKTERQGVAKKRVQMLDERLERLARDLNRTKDPSTIRLGVKETVRLAGPVHTMFQRNAPARRTVGASWPELRADLNRLAKLYSVPLVGRM